jgi:dTDP-glucose 4,6-dehydratase
MGGSMKLLITGGAGFIGSNFLRKFHNSPEFSDIKVLDKLTYAGTKSNFKGIPAESFEFIEGDICNPEIVSNVLGDIDVVINFAAESHVDRSIENSKDFFETNVLGVENLLSCSLKKKIKTFIQISTDEVYGSVLSGSSTEFDPLLPNSPYAASKASADLICRSYVKTYGMDIRITRCSNNYGPNQFPEKIIPKFITNILQGKKVPLYGEGKNVRDWLHVEDHCEAIFLVLTKGQPGEIYNIGGGRELTNNQLTFEIISAMQKTKSEIEFVEDRLGHDFRYSVDHSKLYNDLGYSPRKNFESGLKETLEWYISNKEWWTPLLKR